MELSKAPRLVLLAGCIGTSKLGGGGGAPGGGGGEGIVEVPAGEKMYSQESYSTKEI